MNYIRQYGPWPSPKKDDFGQHSKIILFIEPTCKGKHKLHITGEENI